MPQRDEGSITIRFEAAESQHARACLELYFAELSARFETGFVAGSPDDDLAPPNGCFVVAWRDGSAVGCGGLKRLDPTAGEIKRVWTSPAARGLGVAGLIMRTLEEAAKERGFTRLRLDTNRALVAARAMYFRMGYREIERYNENPYADHWFEKPIS